MLDMDRIAVNLDTLRETELGTVCGEVAANATNAADKDIALRLRQAQVMLSVAMEKMETALWIHSIHYTPDSDVPLSD